MQEIYFGIASYRRPDNQRTLDYLERMGIDRERIIMSVQSAEDKAQYLRDNWNTPGKGTSPAKGYGGILRPVGRDGNGDIVYKFALKGEEDNGEMEQ